MRLSEAVRAELSDNELEMLRDVIEIKTMEIEDELVVADKVETKEWKAHQITLNALKKKLGV